MSAHAQEQVNCIHFGSVRLLPLFLIAVRNTHKTGKLVNKDASPHHCDENQKSDFEQKINRIRHDAVSRSYVSHDRHEDDDECHW